jgi:AcrR family transcriptional regulator
MKRDQHKKWVMESVVDVSRKLFFENGYAKTTIKDIIREAGITTGSLYHFFKGKEDILSHITQDMFDLAVALADEMAGKNSTPWFRLSLEIGLQFYFISTHPPVAELYLAAHGSPEIARRIVHSAQERNRTLFAGHLPGLTADDYYVRSLAVKGIIHSFIQEAVNCKSSADPAFMFRAVETALLIFGVSDEAIKRTIRLTRKRIKQKAPVIYGLGLTASNN